MTLADELERLLQRESDLSADELYDRLGRSKSKVRDASVVLTVLAMQSTRFIELAPGRFAAANRAVETSDPACGEVPTWRELESELRSQLRGRRMVSEIGLGAALLAQVEEELSGLLHDDTDPLVVADQARALLVVCLVSHGIYRYKAGAYWSGFSVSAIDQSYGKAFAKAVRLLELESFDEMVAHDNATRYVAPILAHGGVPKYCLDDYFSLVNSGLRSGASDATDLMTLWRTRRSAFVNIDTPVRRFLLFGGDLSLDFLGRSVDVIRDWSETGTLPTPDQAGLPAYVLSGFRSLTTSGAINPESIKRRREGAARLRPVLRCDPYGLVGPSIEIPKVDSAHSTSVWTISTPDGIRRESASTTSSQSIPIEPSRQWQVQLTSRQELVVDAVFEGIDALPVMFFDSASFEQVPPGLGLRGDDIIVLRPSDKLLQGVTADGPSDVSVLEQLPELTGRWTGFRIERISLAGITALTVGTGDSTRRISVRCIQRPLLVGSPVEGTVGADASEVYSADLLLRLPESAVPWTIRVVVGDQTLRSVVDGGADVDLVDMLPDAHAAHVLVSVRAALGSDLRARFTWVPSLTVTRPDRLALPGEPPPTVLVRSPAVPPLGSAAGSELNVSPEVGSDSVDLLFPSCSEPVGVRVHLPSLRWGVVNEGACELAAEECRLSTADFRAGQAPGFAVSTGERNVPMQLAISTDGVELQRSDKSRAAGAQGQFRFDLGRFADTLGRLDQRADITLYVGNAGVPVRVGTVLPEYEFCDVEVGGIHTGDQALVEVTFTERRPVKGRVVRMWSVGRLWESPLVAAIADGQVGRAEVFFEPAPPPGEYLVEVTVDDGFATPVRPLAHASGVVKWHLGTEHEAHADLLRRSKTEPSAVVESIVATGRSSRPLLSEELQEAVEPALLSWVLLARDPNRTPVSSRALEPLQHVLRLSRTELPQAVDALAGDGELESIDLLRLSIALAPLLAPADDHVRGASTRVVWQIEPSLGALLELAQGASGDLTNATEFLGWPTDSCRAIDQGEPVEQRWLGMELDQLELIRSFLQFDLLPRPLTVDGRVQAILEWLRADKTDGGGLVSKWQSAHHQLLRRPAPMSDEIRAHLDARSAPAGTESWAAFPKTTFAAALHLCGRTDSLVPAQRALSSATAFAPLQVRRDLVLARILVLDLLADDFDQLPTERID